MLTPPFSATRIALFGVLSVDPISYVRRTIDEFVAGPFTICEESDHFHPHQVHTAQVQSGSGIGFVEQGSYCVKVLLSHAASQPDCQFVSLKVCFDL